MMRVRFKETVTDGLRKVFSGQRITAMQVAGATAVIRFLKEHFAKKDKKEPNQLGGDRTHFWNQIGASVGPRPLVRNRVVEIPITDPRFRQKLRGGVIVPKRARALTIPMHPIAHGRSAAQVAAKVGGLFILRTGNRAFLAGKIGRALTIYYQLVKRVVQMPWPGTLPPARSMKWVFTHGVRLYLRRNLRNIKARTP